MTGLKISPDREIGMRPSGRRLSKKSEFVMQNEEVTKILNAIENGDSSASEQLLPLVYQELRKQQWPKKAKLVMLRYFPGLTISEASQAMGVSTATAERYWTIAKTWLFARLNEGLKRLPKKDEGRSN